jgi:hypothetical protein
VPGTYIQANLGFETFSKSAWHLKSNIVFIQTEKWERG